MDALGLALGLTLPALLLVLVISVVRTVRASLGRRPDDRVRRGVERRTSGATAAACVAAVGLVLVTGGVPAAVDPNPLVAAVAVLVVGAVMVATATVVELTWPRPHGTVRTAVARPRPEVAPALRRLRTAGVAALVALCAVTATVGALDGVDRGVRMPPITAFPQLGGGLFPGWPYGLALVVSLGVLTAVAAWGLRVVESRPSLDEEHVGLDTTARLVSTARILRTTACSAWLTVLGVAFVAGSSLHEHAQALRMVDSPEAHYPPFDWRQDLAFALFALGVLAGLLALVAVVSDARPRVAVASADAPDVARVAAGGAQQGPSASPAGR